MHAPDKILVVTCRDDPHADHVIEELNYRKLGDHVVRLNTEDFIGNCDVVFNDGVSSIRILDSGRMVDTTSIRSVWYRRPGELKAQSVDDQFIASYIEQQSTAFLRGFYFQTHTYTLWINSLTAMHAARHKMVQLQLARKIGLRVPRTLVTNNPSQAVRFISAIERLCVKSIGDHHARASEFIYPYLTVRTSREEIMERASDIFACPTMIQEYIDKQFDVRVIVFGGAIYAFAIYSQENRESIVDFRAVSPAELMHKPIILPDDLVGLIQDLMSRQGLVFGALDFVYGMDGAYYFLENNVNGQWLWLEEITGVGLTDSLIKVLLHQAT
ncbi:MAG: hypothetical protein P4L87_00835 [Formivibrio sp.]|nr:hypothetical protein [Formivibrio sp.]